MTTINLDKSLHDVHNICDAARTFPELVACAKELELAIYEAHDQLMEEIVNSKIILENGCLSSSCTCDESDNLEDAVIIFDKCIAAAVKIGTIMSTMVNTSVNPKGV